MLQGFRRHYLDGFILTLHRETYLVEVMQCTDPGTEVHRGQLPDWVFDQRRAIWLDAKGGSIQQRALEGERIKNLLAKRHSRKVPIAG